MKRSELVGFNFIVPQAGEPRELEGAERDWVRDLPATVRPLLR